MPTFDLNTYFAKRAELDAASEQKQAELAAKRADFEQQVAQQTAQQQQVLGDTWVGKLGLDPEGVAGTAVNLGASLAEGGLRIVNNIGSTIHATHAAAELSGIPDNVKEAYQRYAQGKSTREDLTLLALPAGDDAPNKPLTPYQKIARQQAEQQGKLQTNLERLRAAQYALADTQSMQDFDQKAIAPIVERTRQNALQNDLRAGFKENLAKVTDGAALDKVSGLAGMLVNIGTSAASNPVASLEYITNNAPQLGLAAGGGAGMALTNIPYAIDEFGKGLTAYQAQHEGRLPPQKEMEWMAAQAASLALAETLGDKAVLLAGKAVPSAAKDVARAGLKKVLLGNAVGRTALAGLEGATGEFLTEAYQTGVENNIEGKAVTPEDMYVGGAIGAIAGAGLSGGMHGTAELAGATPEKVAKKMQEAVTRQEDTAAKQQAIDSGNVSAYLDPKAKTYAPAKAVEALMGNTQLEDTPVAQREENHAQATKIVSDLQEQRDILADIIERNSPEGRTRLQAQLDAKRAQIAAEPDPAKRAGMEELAAMMQEDLQAALPPAKELAKQVAELKQLDTHLQAARHALTGFTLAQSAATDVSNDLQVASTQTEEAPAAVERLIRLAMASPQRLSTAQVESLSQLPSLSQDQRTYLRSVSEARRAETALKNTEGVNRDVYFGSAPKAKQKFMGIAQYRTQIAQAIAGGNAEVANKLLGQLNQFQQDHSAKAAAAEQAVAWVNSQLATNPNAQAQIQKRAEGGWDVVTDPAKQLSRDALAQNQGHTFHKATPASNKESMATAAKALQAVHNELQAAVNLRFGPQPAAQNNNGDTHVENVPAPQGEPEQQGTQPQATADRVPAAPQQAEPAAGSADAATTSAPVVPVSAAPSLNQELTLKDGSVVRASPSFSQGEYIDGQGNIIDRSAVKAWRNVGEQTWQPVTAATAASSPAAPAVVPPQTSIAEPQASATQAQPEEQGAVAQAAPVNETVTEEAKPDSRLDVLADQSPEGTPFLKRKNLIADFFRQVVHRTDAKTQRPLASVKNFLSQWNEGALDVGRFIDGGVHTEEQRAALEDLRQRMTSWLPGIQANLFKDTKTAEEFKQQDMLQYLLSEQDGKPVVEENVATAIAYAMYDWAMETARSPALLLDEQVNTMFGRDKDAPIDPQSKRELQVLRGHEFAIISDLGKMAVQSLGLKLKNTAPQDLMPRLQEALGVHALAQLERAGLLERVRYSPQQISKLLTGEVNPDLSDRAITLVRVPQDSAFHRTSAARNALDAIDRANGGSKSVVDKLFGVEKAPRFATTAPVKFMQKYAQGTRQKISKLQRRVIEATMATPHAAIPEMIAIHAGLGKEAFLKIAGFRELDQVHLANLSGVEAQNQNLEQQYKLMWEMLDDPDNPEGYETRFYVQQSVWKNFRAGFTTQSLNQQTSKIHRYMFARPNWTATIDPNNTEQVQDLQIALATNFGLKVENQPLDATLKVWEDYKVKHPEILQAATMLASKEELDQDWTAAERALVTDVAASHEGMMTLQALVAMAKFEQAKQSGKPTDITMLVGADGKTNGPMLTHLALGAAEDVDSLYAVLNQGGMYSTEEGQPTSYGDYYARPQAMDLYEGLGAKILEAAKLRMKPLSEIIKLHKAKMHKEAFGLFTPEAWDAFQTLVGKLQEDGKVTKAGRDLTKTPLTAFGFGSSLTNSVKGMENAFIEGLYTTMEKIAQGNHKKLTADSFIAALNGLMQFGDHTARPIARQSNDQLLRLQLRKEQEQALRTAFQRVIGNAVQDAMHEHFHTFIARRGDLNKTIQGSFAAYQAAYQAARTQEITRLLESGELAYRVDKKGNKVPLHDLSQVQEEALRQQVAKLLPVMHTAYSQQEGDLGAGLYLAQETNGKSEDPLHATKIWLANPITNSQGKANNFLTTQAQLRQEISPGVAGTAYAIHSSDSAIMHSALVQVPQSMNVHDEVGNGISRIKKAAKAINEATANTFLNYSPAREAANMLERVVVQTAAQVKDGVLGKEAVRALLQSWADTLNWGLPTDMHIDWQDAGATMLSTTFANARKADHVRLEAIAKMAAMDQYPWHGGTFTVTEAIRKAAQDKIAEIPFEPSPLLSAAVRYLTEVAEQADAAEQPVAKAALAMDPAAGSKTVPEYADTAWGPVGQSRATVPSDRALVNWFEANPNATVRDVIDMLRTQLQEKTLQNALYKRLLDQLAQSAPQNMPVHYITPGTDPAIAVGGIEPKARGWHTSGVGIFVLGQQFEYSGLTAELLMHEMVHATLVDTVDRPASAAARELVEGLKALQEQVKQSGKAAGFSQALDSLHEFIAYGMTNPEFQQVLKDLQVKPQRGNVLVNGMKDFIQKITSLFFGSAKEVQTSALGVLIQDVSGLLAQAQSKTAPATAQRQAMAAQVASYSTQDIYTALNTGAVSPTFSGKLQGLLSNIVEALHGPLGTFSQRLMTAPTLAPVDVWAEAKITGEAPFASLAIASGLPISEQEAFVAEQLEATIRAALDGSETQTKMAYRELAKLYNEAEAKLRGTSHAFLFDIPQHGNRSDYLARFAALGLAHEGFNRALGFNTAAPAAVTSGSIADRLQGWIEQVLGWFQKKVLKTYGGQQADEKLETLVRHLTGIEARKRNTLLREQFKFIEPLEQGVQKAANTARAATTAVLNSGFIRNNANPFIRATGAVGRTVVNGNVKFFMDAIQKLRNEALDSRNGLIMSMFTEFVGADEQLQTVLRATKENERIRKDIITQAGAATLDAFANHGQDLTDEQRSVLGDVFLNTGAHHLLANTSMAELEQLLADPAALQAKIATIEAQLVGTAHVQNYVKAHADALAYFKVTDISTVDVLRMNAHQIAHLAGSPFANRINEQQAAHNTPVVAQLVALYALSHLDRTQRTHARAVLTAENARTDGHGVQFILQLHAHLEQDSLQRLFNGNPALMIHGYTPEIANPYTELEVGDDNPRVDSAGNLLPSSAQELRDRGYTLVGQAPSDPKDPNTTPRWLFMQKDAGLTPRVTGAFSFKGKRAKGSIQNNGYSVNNPQGGSSITQQALAADRALFTQAGRRNLQQFRGSRMVPLFNDQGAIVDWRYMMNKQTRQLKEPDTRFDRLLGSLAGSVFDKESSEIQNRKVIEAAHAMFSDPHTGFTSRSADFLQIGPDVQDPALREMWALLPEATKQAVKDIWGDNVLYVKKDAVDILFGYRKYSLADMFDKDPALRNTTEQIAIHFAETFFGKQARTRVRTFERVWQELVKEAKDLIVIKTGTVMLGNIISNTWLLWQYGVPVKDMLHHQLVAMKGATAYQQDMSALRQLQLKRDSGYLTGAALDQANRDIIKLQDSLDRNPVKVLVDAGLMPTIVEDVAADEDPYSYKSVAQKKLEGITDRIPDGIKTVAKQVYMSHDTAAYQMLSRITQLSDFVARYTLYHHLIERQTDPLTHEEAVQKASDAFINYDVPMHRSVQYLEDMGFLMFNKYFLRIQRVLGTLFKDKPGRMLATMAIKHFIGTGSTVLDSTMWHRIGYNPVKKGALEYAGALDELATVHAALKLIQ